MSYNFICTKDIDRYPTLQEIKERLGDDVIVSSNNRLENKRRVKYFVIIFNSDCPTYREWRDKPGFVISGDGWACRISKVLSAM
jgi:hypothetical protein